MSVVAAVGAMVFWVCAAAIVYPFRPFSTRRRAIVAAAAIMPITIAMMVVVREPRETAQSDRAVSASTAETRGAQKAVLWEASRTTVACRTLRSAEGFAFLDALGKTEGLRNPQSDPSQTDCRHVDKGARFARGDRRPSEHIDEVWFADRGRFYMLSKDGVPAGARSSDK